MHTTFALSFTVHSIFIYIHDLSEVKFTPQMLRLFLFLEGCLPKLITICEFGNPVDKNELAEDGTIPNTTEAKPERTFAQNVTLLSFCFVGLQVSSARIHVFVFTRSGIVLA